MLTRNIFRLTLTLALILLINSSVQAADKSDWYDRSYNFKVIQSALIYSPDFRRVQISEVKERELNEIFMDAAETPNYIAYDVNSLERRGLSRDFMSIYVTAELLQYEVTTRLIPAHWVTRNKSIKETYRDRDGKRRERTISIPYQEYVPDKYVNDSNVSVKFSVYDARTNEAILMREESRVHTDSSNVKGVYTRICKSFFDDLKKRMK